MKARTAWTVGLAWVVLSVPAVLEAQEDFEPSTARSASSRLVMRRASAIGRARAETSAREIVGNVFERLCPGRCELIEVEAVMGPVRADALAEPGFETDGEGSYEAAVQSLRVDILVDSTLPGSFRQNLPRMLRHRLRELAPTVEIRRESVAFPPPQAEPMAPVAQDPLPRFSAPIPRLPTPEADEPPPRSEPDEPVAPAAATPSADATWLAIIPWIGGLLLALVLAAVLLALVRRLGERPPGGTPSTGEADRPDERRRAARLRREVEDAIDQSRGAVNRALARWVQEDPEAVAQLVSEFGPDLLADLRKRQRLAAALEQVGEHLIRRPGSMDPAAEIALFEQARARLAAARIEVDEEGTFEFLEGMGSQALRALLGDLHARERAYVLSELSATTRAELLVQLPAAERRQLALGAASSGTLSPREKRAVVARVRAAADEQRGTGDGRPGWVLARELLSWMDAEEQVQLVEELRRGQPELADPLLEAAVLEGAVPWIAPAVLADAAIQAPVDVLTSFLQGTPHRGTVEAALSEATRRVVTSELAVSRSPDRAEFARARETYLALVAERLRQVGTSIRDLNLRALDEAHGREAAQ